MKTTILLLSLFLSIFAQDWNFERTLLLKKDEFVKMLVFLKGEDKNSPNKKLLEFRWTLFQNGGLVFLTNFDGYMKHNVLYETHPNQIIRLELLSRGASYLPPPVLLLKFIKYDFETSKAHIKVMLSDTRELMELNFIGKYEEE